MKPVDFIAQLLPGAQACQRVANIPVSFTIAQAALESGWAVSSLSRLAHNLFGVKADRSWKGATYALPTTEFVKGKRVSVPATWRAYSSWAECLQDRVEFFKRNPRYGKCWQEKTGEGWARAVAAAGYATDPKYAEKLISVIRAHNLARFDNPEV